jgi:DNA-binding transcriptional regulator YiaG
MRLPDYIDQVGVENFAKQFNVKVRTVKSWKYQWRRPRPDMALEIAKRSPVSLQEIYG